MIFGLSMVSWTELSAAAVIQANLITRCVPYMYWYDEMVDLAGLHSIPVVEHVSGASLGKPIKL